MRVKRGEPRFLLMVYFPVPDKATFCGLPGALSVKDRLPVRRPVCVGVKLTLTMQLAFTASVLPHLVFDENAFSAKSPEVAMLVMLSVEPPVLVTVTVFAPPVLPTPTLPQASEVGLRETIGPLAVTVS